MIKCDWCGRLYDRKTVKKGETFYCKCLIDSLQKAMQTPEVDPQFDMRECEVCGKYGSIFDRGGLYLKDSEESIFVCSTVCWQGAFL